MPGSLVVGEKRKIFPSRPNPPCRRRPEERELVAPPRERAIGEELLPPGRHGSDGSRHRAFEQQPEKMGGELPRCAGRTREGKIRARHEKKLTKGVGIVRGH